MDNLSLRCRSCLAVICISGSNCSMICPFLQVAPQLLLQVAEAVQYAHEREKEIIHRDLKPQNILLQPDEGRPGYRFGSAVSPNSARLPFHPRLTDFGLARVADCDCGINGVRRAIGDPGLHVGRTGVGGCGSNWQACTDVYGLGSSALFPKLTGRPPFQSASRDETLRQAREEEPVPPRRPHATLPRDRETICQKSLAKKMENRYDSARALADDLRRFLAGESILARPVGRLSARWKWVRGAIRAKPKARFFDHCGRRGGAFPVATG